MPRDDTPYVFSVSPYASSVARDMYTGQLGQNDQQDAMRHMLAAGTLARKYNPTIAELFGKAHEYSTSPLAVLRFMLGRGQMPLDYEQDIHNNALGIELGQKAKTQLELEKLVLEAAEQAAIQRTSGRAWIGAVQDDTAKTKYAKGGAVHFDEGGAAFGVFPQMKPRRAQQDRTAAANAPLSALRGWAAGTAGLPGDIEGLARAGISQLPPQLLTAFPALRAFGIGSRADPTPQLPTTEFYNEYLPGAQLNATPTGKLFTGAGNLLGGAGSTTLARYGIKSAKATAKAIAEAAPGPASGSRAAQLGVIKMPGGNWLKGSVEESVSPMKRDTTGRPIEDAVTYGYQPPVTPETTALNNWVDSNLTNYVKKQMGTADDPVRKLAEQGITHKPALLDAYLNDPLSGEQMRTNEHVGKKRSESGFPVEGMGQSPMAKAWERASDESIGMAQASDIQNSQFVNYSPYMGYKDEVLRDNPWINKLAPETKVYSAFTGDLGFDHIMDVLREDVTAGRIRPEQLNKVSMEQAVRRTYEYDQELAAKMNASRAAAREGLPTYREYPEGYKWIQLTKPGSFAQESEAMGHSVRGYEPPKGHPDWVEGSGNAGSSGYGHGGWEAIKSGKAKVYSLVDSKGAPHATVEIKQIGMTPEQRRYKVGFLAAQLEKEGQTAENALRQAEKIYPDELKESITQIKGKQNRAPNEEYLPYVQDFVKGGQWSGVGDLQNTGLVKHNGKIMTRGEADDLILKELNEAMPGITDDLGLTTPTLGMAQGGLVSNHFDPIKIKQIIAGLDDEYDPENIQQIIAQRESAYA